MLDLDALFADTTPATVPGASNAKKTAERLEPSSITPDSPRIDGGEAGHSGHNGLTPIFDEVCPRESLQHRAFNRLGTVGTLGTVDFQGGEGQTGDSAPGGGAVRNEFALHPAAVILALAYSRAMNATNEERASSLLSLHTLPPGEQVRCWSTVCIEAGVKPWEVLMIQAPASGLDCTMCKHLTTRQMAGNGERRQFHWACDRGYLILETGRATERIWIAPPECQSFERWVPAGRGG